MVDMAEMHGCDFVYKLSSPAVKIPAFIFLCRVATACTRCGAHMFVGFAKTEQVHIFLVHWTLGKSMIFFKHLL